MFRRVYGGFKIGERIYKIPVYEARRFAERLIGLSLRRDFNGSLLFRFNKSKRWAFHTHFMRFSIVMLFLRKEKIVDVVKLNPWKFYKPAKPCDSVLEVPIKYDVRVSPGDTLIFFK